METNKLVQAFETELNLTEQGLRELSEQKKGLVIDVTTESGFKLARKERTEQNKLLKNIDDLAISGKRSVDDARGILKERVTEIYAPNVTAFEAEDIRRKEEAKRLEQIEAERLQNMRNQINSISAFAMNANVKSVAELQDIIEAVDMIDVSENFAELTQEALAVKKETLASLNISLMSAIQNEQLSAEREQLRKEREAVEQERAEFARWKAEQAKASEEVARKAQMLENDRLLKEREAEQARAQQEEHRLAKDHGDQQQENIASGNAVAQVDNDTISHEPIQKEQPITTTVADRLAKRFENIPSTAPSLSGRAQMMNQLNFWKEEYGVRNTEFNDLMNIINQHAYCDTQNSNAA